uniref:Uncharacterized protein n=1 Tax=viral metagenome TaxID=1070528 RepID=A0A6M3LCV3_9ZZZZ
MKKQKILIIGDDEEKKIIRALLSTWDEIGGDTLRCLEDCGEKPVMPRDHVAEVVCDAGRLEMFGGKEDKEAIKKFRKIKYGSTQWKKIINKAFPYKRYGW